MSATPAPAGGRSVGHMADLSPCEANLILFMRLWCDGTEGRAAVWSDLSLALGAQRARAALGAFEMLFNLCARHARRPLMRHAVPCCCVGADEACFANFVMTAATGERDDAMLIATLLVRPDVAPVVTSVAAEVGLALHQMSLRPPLTAELPSRPDVLH